MSRYLVTGAAGFLGREVVRKLSASGRAVRAMVQHRSDAAHAGDPAAQIVVADLLDPQSLRAAVCGVDIVCHCAARLPGDAPPEVIWNVNVAGTANLLAAMVEARVRRLVYVSTDSVYGDADTRGATEEAPLDPGYLHEGNYPLSKLEAEKLAWRAAEEHGLVVTVIRPCFMYGPGPSAGTDQLQRIAAKRIHRLVGAGASVLSMAYVTDVAEAIVLASRAPAAQGRTYNVSSGEPHSLRDLSRIISEVTGRKRFLLPLPGTALLPWARAAHALLAPVAPRIAARLDPRRIMFCLANHSIDIGRIERELGYVPRVSLREGLRRTFAPGSAPDASRPRQALARATRESP